MSKTNSLLPEPNRAQTFIFSGELCLSPSLSSFSLSLFSFLSLCSIYVCVCFHLFWVLIVKCRQQTRAYIAASFSCTLLWHPLHLFSPLSSLFLDLLTGTCNHCLFGQRVQLQTVLNLYSMRFAGLSRPSDAIIKDFAVWGKLPQGCSCNSNNKNNCNNCNNGTFKCIWAAIIFVVNKYKSLLMNTHNTRTHTTNRAVVAFNAGASLCVCMCQCVQLSVCAFCCI